MLYSTASFIPLPLHMEQPILDSDEEYGITVTCSCSTVPTTLKQDTHGDTSITSISYEKRSLLTF